MLSLAPGMSKLKRSSQALSQLDFPHHDALSTFAGSTHPRDPQRSEAALGVDSYDNHINSELRVNPPRVTVENQATGEPWTVVTVDSANRPGILVEVVQNFTEMNLVVRKAWISSDGGWFVDVFHVSTADGTPVLDPDTLDRIRHMLNWDNSEYLSPERGSSAAAAAAAAAAVAAHAAAAATVPMDSAALAAAPKSPLGNSSEDDEGELLTVFELGGPDRPGLLLEVVTLLEHRGLVIVSSQLWTHTGRVALVIACRDKGRQGMALHASLNEILGQYGAGDGSTGVAFINANVTSEELHTERRLHALMLQVRDLEDAQEMRSSSTHTTPRDATMSARGSEDRLDALVAQAWPSCVRRWDESGAGAARSAPLAASPGIGHNLSNLSGGGVVMSSSYPDTLEAAASQTSQQQKKQSSSRRAAPTANHNAADINKTAQLSSSSPTSTNAADFSAPTTPSKPGSDVSQDEEVAVTTSTAGRSYTHIYVRCPDRAKLLFDTVCTLADLQYSVYHATIDSAAGMAYQEYYVLNSITNAPITDRVEKRLVERTMRAAIARRSTKGIRVAADMGTMQLSTLMINVSLLVKSAGLNVTKADVAMNHYMTGMVFHVLRSDGSVPTREEVEECMLQMPAHTVVGEVEASPNEISHAFGAQAETMERMVRQLSLNWAGGPVEAQ
ncbi:ACT domain-containing protein ACR5 [Pycnococcus provasolii]